MSKIGFGHRQILFSDYSPLCFSSAKKCFLDWGKKGRRFRP